MINLTDVKINKKICQVTVNNYCGNNVWSISDWFFVNK